MRPFVAWLLASFAVGCAAPAPRDPLPSWNDTASKKTVMDFVTRVTTAGGSDFVAPSERIATFDNDGTLWAEQPIYFQFLFALDRLKARDREWAYDRASSIGKLDQGLDEARAKHWTVVDMKTDWARIFAFEPK